VGDDLEHLEKQDIFFDILEDCENYLGENHALI